MGGGGLPKPTVFHVAVGGFAPWGLPAPKYDRRSWEDRRANGRKPIFGRLVVAIFSKFV